jgi:type VII secretion protein EccE
MTTTTARGAHRAPAPQHPQRPAAAAAAHTLPRWRFTFPLRHIIIGELIAAAIIVAAARLPWWVLAIASVAVLITATLSYKGATALGWIGRKARGVRARRSSSTHAKRATIPAAFSVELPGVGPIGMRWDGQYAITMIALHGRAFAPTVLVPEGADTPDTVPLEVIGNLLRQFGGLELHSIDVASVGSRTARSGRYTPRYDEIVGDRPAVGERRSWLVLRLCPQACLRALAYRGDAKVAAAAATERIRQAAVRAGCRAATCSAEQIDAATDALLAGHPLDRFDEHWADLQVGSEYVTPYRIAGNDLTTRLLNDVWTIRSTTAMTLVRLTRNPDASVAVAALVRLHTTTPLPHPPLLALHPVSGQAFSALLASLPLGNRSLVLPLSPKPLPAKSPTGSRTSRTLAVPVGPSGFLFGMTLAGVPFLMSITDPLKFTRLAINADIDVVESLLLRATAAGGTALVHTDRPELWAPICDDRIMLAGRTEPRVTPTLVAADGETAQRLLATSGERGHTLIAITPTPPVDSDIVITQISPAEIVLTTPLRRDVSLTIMRPRNETQFLSHLRTRAGLP